jgi:hypothetical protein
MNPDNTGKEFPFAGQMNLTGHTDPIHYHREYTAR